MARKADTRPAVVKPKEKPKKPTAGQAKPVTPRKKSIASPKTPRKPVQPQPTSHFEVLTLLVLELLLLSVTGLLATISVLGRAANWFGGTDLTQSLLPFAGTVLILTIGSSLLLAIWFRLRRVLNRYWRWGRVVTAALILLLMTAYASRPGFQTDLVNLKMLVGGSEVAGQAQIAHQVYAAYRRADLQEVLTILERSQAYEQVLHDAAVQNHINEDVLAGVGATESSFLPRDSKDGGRGLFQITAAPKSATERVKTALKTDQPDPHNDVHNIYLAAATLHHYLGEMKGDLFLGLLAYNIGPKNGGLLSIMNQYGARDFTTIQPYLKDLPRDYPIRVLTFALAHRLWKVTGQLPRYEEGQNARFIQEEGIPGLELGRVVP